MDKDCLVRVWRGFRVGAPLDQRPDRPLELADMVDLRLIKVLEAMNDMTQMMEPDIVSSAAKKRRKGDALQVARALHGAPYRGDAVHGLCRRVMPLAPQAYMADSGLG